MTQNNAMTVDVEDFFQVSAFESYVSRENWKNFAGRVEENTDRILELFDQHDVKATFFTLGWVAENYPELVTMRFCETVAVLCCLKSHFPRDTNLKPYASKTCKAAAASHGICGISQ